MLIINNKKLKEKESLIFNNVNQNDINLNQKSFKELNLNDKIDNQQINVAKKFEKQIVNKLNQYHLNDVFNQLKKENELMNSNPAFKSIVIKFK